MNLLECLMLENLVRYLNPNKGALYKHFFGTLTPTQDQFSEFLTILATHFTDENHWESDHALLDQMEDSIWEALMKSEFWPHSYDKSITQSQDSFIKAYYYDLIDLGSVNYGFWPLVVHACDRYNCMPFDIIDPSLISHLHNAERFDVIGETVKDFHSLFATGHHKIVHSDIAKWAVDPLYLVALKYILAGAIHDDYEIKGVTYLRTPFDQVLKFIGIEMDEKTYIEDRELAFAINREFISTGVQSSNSFRHLFIARLLRVDSRMNPTPRKGRQANNYLRSRIRNWLGE